MPSVSDDSQPTPQTASGRHFLADMPGVSQQVVVAPVPVGRHPCKWLADFIARGMVSGGVDANQARTIAWDIAPSIMAAFDRLTDLDHRLNPGRDAA